MQPLDLIIHQQLVVDRRQRLERSATRSRRARAAAAPDLTRTTDVGSSVLPVRSPAEGVRVGDTLDLTVDRRSRRAA